MTSTGLLTVRAQLQGAHLAAIDVELRRPAVTRLFIDQIPEAVVKTVPYLYTLCAHAQRAAAQAALAAAQGESRRPVDDAELWIEVLHENLWRLLLDWPLALGLAPAKEAFVAWRAGRQGSECISATRHLLDTALRDVSEKCLENLVDRDAPADCSSPLLNAEDWLAFWQGNAASPPAVHRPATVVAAYRARLAEVERAGQALAAGAPFPIAAAGQAAWGVGQTLTARGVLTHAVHLVDGRVLNYRVDAPTDALFADAGALTALLAGRTFAHAAEARLALDQAILALDPCVPYSVELNHA